jgi:hypothetical protein
MTQLWTEANNTIIWDPRFFGILRSVKWQFFTDVVSGQRIGPIIKGQEVQEDFLTFEDGPDTLSRNVGIGLALHAA